MILANGCPKSGTHLLMAHLHNMGLRRHPGIVECWYDGRPTRYRDPESQTKHLKLDYSIKSSFVHSHVHSGVQYNNKYQIITVFRDPRNVLISYMREYENRDPFHDFYGQKFVSVYNGFLGWRDKGPCVRFEDMAPAAPNLLPGSATWSGLLTNWEEYWNSELNAAWKKAGGNVLLRKSGYA